MNPQLIRLEALKLAIASDGQRQFVVPSDVLITQAARFAAFIISGKVDVDEARADGRPDYGRDARLRSFNDEY